MAALIINTSELVDVQGNIHGRVSSTLDGNWMATREGQAGYTMFTSQLEAFAWLMDGGVQGGTIDYITESGTYLAVHTDTGRESYFTDEDIAREWLADGAPGYWEMN